MKKVVLTPGWNGGFYQIEGKQISFKKGRTYNANINGTDVVCFVKTTHDYDSDHGHRYDWNRQDLYFNVSVLGIITEIPALPYIQKGLFLINEESLFIGN